MPTAPPDNADLFEEVTRLDTLERAWARVLRNAGAAGGDGLTVGRFAEAAPSRLLALRRALRMGDYRPGPLRRLSIPKPDGALRPTRWTRGCGWTSPAGSSMGGCATSAPCCAD